MNYNVVFPVPLVESSDITSIPVKDQIADGWDPTPRMSEIPPSEIDGEKVLPPGHIAFLSASAVDAMIAHRQEP